jgi:hypothetical protein
MSSVITVAPRIARSFHRLGQRQIVLSASKGRLKPAVDSTGTVKRLDLADPGLETAGNLANVG